MHGKGSLLGKMPGDRWQKLANLRALYAYMWAHPGKKLLFMGGEFAQEREWNHDRSLDWHLLESAEHAGVQALVRDLNRVYRDEPALWEVDFSHEGFRWLEANDAATTCSRSRGCSRDGERVARLRRNLSPVPRYGYRVGMPRGGRWREALNTDSRLLRRLGRRQPRRRRGEDGPWHDQPFSAEVTLPPLGVVWLVPGRVRATRRPRSETSRAA